MAKGLRCQRRHRLPYRRGINAGQTGRIALRWLDTDWAMDGFVIGLTVVGST
jgi:hypothetical protein